MRKRDHEQDVTGIGDGADARGDENLVDVVLLGYMSECLICGRTGTSLVGMMQQGSDWRASAAVVACDAQMLRLAERLLSAEARYEWRVGPLSFLPDSAGVLQPMPCCFACGQPQPSLRGHEIPEAIDAFGVYALHAIGAARVPEAIWASLGSAGPA